MSDEDSFPDPDDIRGSWKPSPPKMTDSKLRRWGAVIVSASFLGCSMGLYAGGIISPIALLSSSFAAGVVFAGMLFMNP